MTGSRYALFAGLAWAAGTLAAAAQDKPLTTAQTDLIELISLMQIAAQACSLQVDSQLLGLAARQEGLTLKSAAEKKLIGNAMADARLRFSSQKRGVECLAIVDRYGPQGTEMKGLLRKR